MSTTFVTPETDARQQSERETKQPRLWNVVLLDDDQHTYDYVMRLVQALFGHSLEKAFEIAETVDTEGRAVCLTTHRELGELKIEQIRGYGADPLLGGESNTSMRATLEPAT